MLVWQSSAVRKEEAFDDAEKLSRMNVMTKDNVPSDVEKGRFHSRTAADARLHLYWNDSQHGPRQMPARAVDRSSYGLMVEADRSIPNGTVVMVQTAQGLMVGQGTVRHSEPKGINYLIGLYLPDRLARGF